MSPSIQTETSHLTLTRIFNASSGDVFDAWTAPARVALWWGPDGFTNPICELDARPGGAIRIVMHAPDGTDYPMSGVFREVAEPTRLVFTSVALDEKSNPLFEVLNTVTFVDKNGRTEQTLQARVLKKHAPSADKYLAGMRDGWNQSLDRLARHLASESSANI